MNDRMTGQARADTGFGPLAGRTAIEVLDQGDNSVVISFRCGHTPVVLALAGANYHAFVRACIDKASPQYQEKLNTRLDAVIEGAA